MTGLLLATLLIPASAGAEEDVLLHDEQEIARAKRSVRWTSGLSGDELDEKTIPDLLTGHAPVEVVGARALSCDRDEKDRSTNEQVAVLLAAAERSAAPMTTEGIVNAILGLEQARGAMGCLSEVVEPDLAARVLLLEGLLRMRVSQDREGQSAQIEIARQRFQRAAAFTPDPEWISDWFNEEERESLERYMVPAASVELLTFPSAACGVVSIDGRPCSSFGGALAAGEHLIQVATSPEDPLTVTISEGQTAAVLVAGVAPEPARDAAFGPAAEALSLSLGSLVGDGKTVFVVSDGRLASSAAGSGDWSYTSTPRLPPWIFQIGIGIGAGSAALAGGSLTRVLIANARMEGETGTYDDYLAEQEARARAEGWWWWALGGIGLGAVVAGTERLSARGVRLAASPEEGGVAVELTVTERGPRGGELR